MTDSSSRAWVLTRPGNSPIVLVYAYDHEERAEVRRLFEAVAPAGLEFSEAGTLDDALGQPSTLVFFSPIDESACLRELEERRDELEGRTAPLIVFVLRGGAAFKLLPDLPWLASFLRGRDLDPAESDGLDVGERRSEFETRTGLNPAEWLARYDRNEFPDDDESNTLAAEALFLTREP